jgi:hypothetical protein
MLRVAVVLTCCAVAGVAQTSEEQAVLSVVQRFFDVLASRDAAAGRALVIAQGRSFSIREDGKIVESGLLEMVEKLPSGKGRLLERMFEPSVRIRGKLASVWAKYDFHRDGKFSHCGVDSFLLVKAPEGWKIASLAYTVEPGACAELGVPKRPL